MVLEVEETVKSTLLPSVRAFKSADWVNQLLFMTIFCKMFKKSYLYWGVENRFVVAPRLPTLPCKIQEGGIPEIDQHMGSYACDPMPLP